MALICHGFLKTQPYRLSKSVFCWSTIKGEGKNLDIGIQDNQPS